MTSSNITIQVDEETAKAFTTASDEQRRKMELLLRLRLQDLTGGAKRSLKSVMDEIGGQAQERGLTQESLESLLHDE